MSKAILLLLVVVGRKIGRANSRHFYCAPVAARHSFDLSGFPQRTVNRISREFFFGPRTLTNGICRS